MSPAITVDNITLAFHYMVTESDHWKIKKAYQCLCMAAFQEKKDGGSVTLTDLVCSTKLHNGAYYYPPKKIT